MKRICLAVIAALLFGLPQVAVADSPQPGQYRNFRAAIYVVVGTTRELADRAEFEKQYARVAKQLKFDKVYVEVYRDHVFATDEEIEAVKIYFREKGVTVAGGVTLAAGGHGGQFGTFDYEDQADRAECKKAAELAAKHFDEVILDDFFFYTSKSDADIAAKGTKSWTEYRLEKMRDAAANLVIGPAKAVNPNVRMVIKYPNWYEHFQGLGYDLDKEAHLFDGIYTGTETRDAMLTDQFLQEYQSYGIIRFYDNVRSDGGNGGGWVDTGSLRTADRYVDQLQDTLFAKAPEITLFNWVDMAGPRPLPPEFKALKKLLHGPQPGNARDWINKANFAAMARPYRRAGKGDPGPGWARAAGYALEEADKVLGALGKPVGIFSYKPYQSHGEDFLQNYLGNIGIPVEMTPNFPIGAEIVLLTESAAGDPDIVHKIELQLNVGRDVVVTSGFLKAMQDKGFKDIAEWEVTGRVANIADFVDGFGAGNGASLNEAKKRGVPVLFPEVRFYTNDSWATVRGFAGSKGYPILLMNRYSKGTIYLLAVPENPADLYNLPQPLVARIKAYLMPEVLARLDAPPKVALFAYDNGALVVHSFRNDTAVITISLPGEGVKLRDAATGKPVAATPLSAGEKKRREIAARWFPQPERTIFTIRIAPHAFKAFNAGS
jgi:hypothetical protein